MTVLRISPKEADAKMREGWVYVDVRPRVDFALGHPVGAVNVPFDARPADDAANLERFVADVRAATGPGARLVVGCRAGVVSVRAAEALAAAGEFAAVVEQRAGFEGVRGTFGELREPGWEREGLAVERDSDRS